MTYESTFGTLHTVETITEDAIYLPYKTKREYVSTEGDRVVIYNIEGELRVKDYDAFHTEYKKAKFQSCLC